ncbi:hypothetical protein ACFFU8_09345 [Chromobacterium piscinae]|uniref:hypothetical protein n=1 Tax=Chromobacterium piscinae TaxID=686831 RepID=UPI001E5D2A63|nr:hypothetical protein [Chromobacterium piscinae]MCD5327891.1 hypothetical protein [Chromobacterium piscinae]
MKPLQAGELSKLVSIGVIRMVALKETPDGWTIQFNDGAYASALDDGRARFFASTDSALKFLKGRGIFNVSVHMTK